MSATARLTTAIIASLANGRRLLEAADWLESQDSAISAFLIAIAKEEFAKAFLLALVVRAAIPWDGRLIRAARDHTCKQLLCIVMDYLSPDDDEFIERCNAVVLHHEPHTFPRKVADAINLLRHEKIGRWVSQSWLWAEEPEYDREALSIAKGKQDKTKQDLLYVRLAKNGHVSSVPKRPSSETVRTEMQQAERFASLVERLLDGAPHPAIDYDLVEETFKLLFREVAA